MEAEEIQTQIARGKEKGYIRQLPDGRLAFKTDILGCTWLAIKRDAPKSFLVERNKVDLSYYGDWDAAIEAIKIEITRALESTPCYLSEEKITTLKEWVDGNAKINWREISHAELILKAPDHYLNRKWGNKYLEEIVRKKSDATSTKKAIL